MPYTCTKKQSLATHVQLVMLPSAQPTLPCVSNTTTNPPTNQLTWQHLPLVCAGGVSHDLVCHNMLGGICRLKLGHATNNIQQALVHSTTEPEPAEQRRCVFECVHEGHYTTCRSMLQPQVGGAGQHAAAAHTSPTLLGHTPCCIKLCHHPIESLQAGCRHTTLARAPHPPVHYEAA